MQTRVSVYKHNTSGAYGNMNPDYITTLTTLFNILANYPFMLRKIRRKG